MIRFIRFLKKRLSFGSPIICESVDGFNIFIYNK